MTKAKWYALVLEALSELASDGRFDTLEGREIRNQVQIAAMMNRKPEVHAYLGYEIKDPPRIKAEGPQHWTVKFMRLGQEPPHPFGSTTAVVCAESRDGAKSLVSGMANDYWPITASATTKPVTYPFSCGCGQ